MKPRLAFGLTTIPERSKTLNLTLNSLLDQDLKPDVIYVTLVKDRKYDFGNLVIDTEKIKFIELETDYGPINKLLGPLIYEKKYETNQDQWIITVDDDVIYQKDLVSQYVNIINEGVNFAFCFGGLKLNTFLPSVQRTNFKAMNFGESFLHFSHLQKFTEVDWLIASAGAVFALNHFSGDDIELMKQKCLESDLIRKADDALIAAILKRKNIHRYMIRYDGPTLSQDCNYNESALSRNVFRAYWRHLVAYQCLNDQQSQPSTLSWMLETAFYTIVFVCFCLLAIKFFAKVYSRIQSSTI